MRRDVRIVLVGDDGVGKSTIITSLIKESFISNVQHIVPEVTIPPEVTPENVTTSIVDTGCKPDDRPHLESEARKAHVICIVYAIDNPHSFSRIPTYWLPYFRGLGVNVPVILVGNKIDLRTSHPHSHKHHGAHTHHPHPYHPSSNPNRLSLTNQSLEDEIAPIMAEFKEVETCVESSAKLPLNISEVFYFAQKAVLHPTAPLYDSREHALKPACEAALRRIFKLCDVDKNGILDDAELNEFQRKCFDSPLQAQELEGIQEMVRQYGEDGVANINTEPPEAMNSPQSSMSSSYSSLSSHASSSQRRTLSASSSFVSLSQVGTSSSDETVKNDRIRMTGLTETGFLYLHTIFIQRGRLETTWTVLRKFGYGDDLRLTETFLAPKFDIPHGCSVELSQKGYEFFTGLFVGFDKDRDGALNSVELANLFETAPGNPWINQGFPDTTISDDSGAVTLQGWLAQWSMTTLLEYKQTLAYLAYLGYPDADTTTALKITHPRRLGRRAKAASGKGNVGSRNVFLCWVCGAAGSGKTALLRHFVRKGFRESYMPTTKGVNVVNSVEVDGAEKYLVIQEFGSRYEAENLRNAKRTEVVDVIIYVYDSSDTNSFSYISNLRQQYSLDHIPSLFVATKADLDLAQQRHEVQPDVYCRRLSLQVPVAVSVKTSQTADVFATICKIAMNPTTHFPGGPKQALIGVNLRSPATLTMLFFSFASLFYVSRTSFWRSLHTSSPGVGLFASLAAWWTNWSTGRLEL
ncbi:ERMES complex Ca(2+)-binding regulatory GTPase gem1 [Serendipita sp. 401]|nr:ERMES complex Ca(2+)-binding regulatory GTPase gem1 [Serendipita sp. 401]KAG9057247.1 ERMES complex Ca(2+)-binding regulatory GTPase gem1 [Serendipita sp. 407]